LSVTDKQLKRDIYKELSRKWTIPILKDLFLGAKRFTDFLEVPRNIDDHLSNRVLADQLDRLVRFGFIEKKINPTSNKIEYSLTKMSLDLNKMLYEKLVWAIKYGIIERDDPYLRGKNIEEAFGIEKRILS